jgi:hypothetical protein
MKNEKLLFVLVPVMIIIWGTIFYKLFFKTKEAIVIPTYTIEEEQENTELITESWKLNLTYKDPFLKGRVYGSLDQLEKKETKKKEKEIDPPIPVVTIKWPNIQYMGFVDDRVSLNINGYIALMNVGDEEVHVFLLSNMGDSILLGYQEEEKIVYLSN